MGRCRVTSKGESSKQKLESVSIGAGRTLNFTASATHRMPDGRSRVDEMRWTLDCETVEEAADQGEYFAGLAAAHLFEPGDDDVMGEG